MRFRALLIAGCVGLLSALPPVDAQAQSRSTPVFRLTEGKHANFDVRGIGQNNASHGTLDIEYKNGHAMMHLEVDSLGHPQRVGAAYTAYVFWGVTADGKVTRLGELVVGKRIDLKADLTAQTVGFLATAEPYAEVELPSPELAMRFTLVNTQDKNAPLVKSARYVGDKGDLYSDEGGAAKPDFGTPLLVQSARHAVAIARRAGAVDFAPTEWREVDVKVEVLEQRWPDQRNNEEKFSGNAREVIRLADAARRIGAERAGSAAAAAERTATAATLDRAADDLNRARKLKADAERDADDARASADSASQLVMEARASADRANESAARTLNYADSVRTSANLAAAAAENDASAARLERDNARARLATSISAILFTKREARGLVVNLSGVFFMTGQAVLQPAARESLSKLSGIMLAYPGPYALSIGGHTDAVGSDEMNDKLSQARAESVRAYLIGAGISASHLTSATGFGKHQPVADNATADGRAKNRRVEIVIDDTDPSIH